MNQSVLTSTITRLDSGLSVVCVPQNYLHTAALALHVRVGSRFETVSSSGLSHFLEHMLFRGTTSYESAHEQALALERLGGTLYAATHTDFGVLSLSLPPENILETFDVFAEVITAPRFADIEIERGIIREEILESLDEDGAQIDPDNLTRELIYGDHGLGLSITGSLEGLDCFGVEDLRTHHRRHYSAHNSVLTFAGAIDSDRCINAAKKLLAAMPTGQKVPIIGASEGQRRPRFKYVENQNSQTELRLAFRAPGEHDPQEPAAELLVRLLDDGMSTRLYARVCDELGLCYDVSSEYETFEDDGVFDLGATVQHTRVPQVMGELVYVVQQIAKYGPTQDEMDKAKARHRWETFALLDHADGLADYFGLSTLMGKPVDPCERDRQIANVTAEQVQAVARRIFQPGRLSAVAVGMLEAPERKALEQLVRDFRLLG